MFVSELLIEGRQLLVKGKVGCETGISPISAELVDQATDFNGLEVCTDTVPQYRRTVVKSQV